MPDPITPVVTANWFDGKPEAAEIIAHAQNKGWDVKDPAALALAAGKAHLSAEKLIGVPPNELVRLPKDKSDEAGWKNVWNRLGTPSDPKEYDFPTLKGTDGKPTNEALDGMLRAAFAKTNMTKDAAAELSQTFAKYLTDQSAATAAQKTAALIDGRAALAKEWNTTPERLQESPFMLAAKNAAAALKITPDAINALESTIGYEAVMRMLANISTKIGEDKFTGNNEPGGSKPGLMSKDQAKDLLSSLRRDPAWTKRYLEGGFEEGRKMTELLTIIGG
jgi:hypothetical protein